MNNAPEIIVEILKLIQTLGSLVEDIIKAAASENPARVQDIVPLQLETSIAKLRADIEALRKFGPRP